MGLYLNVIPGFLKVRVTKRGVRAGIGPRICRVWAGPGGDGISTGVGPLSYYHPIKHPAQSRQRWHGTLPDGWRCPHRHFTEEKAIECAQKRVRLLNAR